jgi:hypothetical protein
MQLMQPPRLQIGSGEHYFPSWVNVDLVHPGPPHTVDVIANAMHLPFPDGIFNRVYCGHFWEHIPWHIISYIWRELRRVAYPQATFCIVGPAMDLALEQGVPDWLLEAIAAKDPPDPSPGAHAWTATTEKTKEAIELGGLKAKEVPITSVLRPAWPNPAPLATWQCAFLAHA